ncbi:MAG: hypothetical protein JWM31_231, partial [Solirubrobacterales bacterium]|nr:hypothetical protein [Solirubrobacterales bacterium]
DRDGARAAYAEAITHAENAAQRAELQARRDALARPA